MDNDIIHVPAQLPRNVPCKIAFLGEAPSTDELLAGKPLVGPSGRIFDALLRTANLDRADYWVGNVFDQKLPDNDVANWCVNKNAADQWEDDPEDLKNQWYIPGSGVLRPEHRWHLRRLMDELEAVRPNVVVPMGSTALWAMAAVTNISDYRGNLMPSKGTGTIYKLLPTFHPAHVMRTWKFFPVVVGDFVKAARAAEMGPELVLPKKHVILAPTLTEIKDYINDELLKSPLICPDIETGWGQMTCIGFAASSKSAICIPFVDLSKPGKSYWGTEKQELEALMLVKDVMESSIPKVGQNFAAYDAYWLWKKYGIKTINLLHDTRLLHQALYPELPKSLSFMSGSYTMQGPWKMWGHKSKKDKRDD
jgi:uracil-DNA glycosylase